MKGRQHRARGQWRAPALSLGLAAVLACTASPTPEGPSILLVTLDTVRRDHVSPYAGRPITPRLGEFATSGRRYTAAYTTMPTTSPSHASLFTGQHPFEHGVRRNGMRLRREDAEARSLTARLQEAGYATGAFLTANVMGSPPLGLPGLDAVDAPRGERRSGMRGVERALSWLAAPRPEGPVFLWVHLFDAHSPYGREAEKKDALPIDRSTYGWVDRQRFEEPAARRDMAKRYARGIRQLDKAFGRLWSAWREQMGPDTLVLVVADHGEFLDEHLDEVGFAYGHGALLGEAVLGVPLLLAGVGVEPGVSREPVSIRDVYTTLLEAAGVGDPTAASEGRRDLRRGDSAQPGRVVSAERRMLDASYWKQHGVTAPPLELVEGRAVAVADGQRLLVLSAQGEPMPSDDEPAPPGLLATGRERASAYRGEKATREQYEVDEKVREALRSLGYAE